MARAAACSDDPLYAVLEELGGGAVLVLDERLRVTAWTPRATALLGKIPLGVQAAKLLCAGRAKRPLAEALAAGRAVTAEVPRTIDGDERMLRIRAVPARSGGTTLGWALLLQELPAAADGPELFHGLWTVDEDMKRMFRIVERVALSDAAILVRGETGAGKELVATAVHALSSRAAGPLRAINCAAMPTNLLESELFGHVRGAFTGAVSDTPGHFKLAHGGTLFLDEVAELSLELQAKLLRVLETGTVLPVGARQPIAVDVRIVAATHRALRREVEAGRFRADLMYRLRVIPVFIPPLRARPDDVILIAEKTIASMNARYPRQIARIAEGAKAALRQHDWPGNVRELKNALHYAFAIGDGPVLVEADLPPELLAPFPDEMPPVAPVATADRPLSPEAARLLRALQRADGNRERCAASLGISRVTLWRRLRELGLSRHPLLRAGVP